MSNQIIAIYHDGFLQAQWRFFTLVIVDCYILDFSLIPPHGLVRALVRIAAYIGSTFLIDYIITIYHNSFSPSKMA